MRTRIHSRLRRLVWVGVALAALAFTGCADMKDQPRFRPLRGTEFFADGRSARPLVEGTVARGFLREDDRVYRGIEADGTFVKQVPLPIDTAMLQRGQERYDIFCSPCHSQLGDGRGMIVQRGYKQPTSYHDPRLRAVEDGYIYDVITNGFGQMSGYASQVKPHDRWAIVAYVRALQLAADAQISSVPADVRQALQRGETVDVRAHDEHDSDQGEHHGSAH